MIFTLSGALEGARRCWPIAFSSFAIGLVFGVLARQAGVGAVETVLMSVLVFSGAAQFLVLGLWAAPLPVATIALATLVVGLRHLLRGAALAPWFAKLARLKAYASVFFMADENWALTVSGFSKGRRDAAFLLGGGLAMFLSWTSSTLIGRTIGGALEGPERWGLDFAFTAVFLALLVGMGRGTPSCRGSGTSCSAAWRGAWPGRCAMKVDLPGHARHGGRRRRGPVVQNPRLGARVKPGEDPEEKAWR